MSQIVEAFLRHPDLLDDGLESPVHGEVAEVAADVSEIYGVTIRYSDIHDVAAGVSRA